MSLSELPFGLVAVILRLAFNHMAGFVQKLLQAGRRVHTYDLAALIFLLVRI